MPHIAKLENLFIRHLRVVYDAEKTMENALSVMSRITESSRLAHLYRIKAEEKKQIVSTLEAIFRILHTNSDGEKDSTIHALTDGIGEHSDEFETAQAALHILGRSTSIYQENAYKTAISCARELEYNEVASLLQDCLDATKFNRDHISFLEKEIIAIGEMEGLLFTEIAVA